MRLGLISLWAAYCLLALPIASASDEGDSSSYDPLAFGDAIASTHAVVLRVPISNNGEENTDAAEMRFINGDINVNDHTNPEDLWKKANKIADSAGLRGEEGPEVDPRTDSSTWGWYYWYYRGWAYPYFYYSYYPTFYYNYSWYYYRPYYYWSFPYYRYYYYYR